MNFDFLVQQIERTHRFLNQAAVKTINIHLTLRNWLIGFYIVEFEQMGENRAAYGSKLINNLSNSLRENGLSNINERELRRYRLFYKTYSGLGQVFSVNSGGSAPRIDRKHKKGDIVPSNQWWKHKYSSRKTEATSGLHCC